MLSGNISIAQMAYTVAFGAAPGSPDALVLAARQGIQGIRRCLEHVCRSAAYARRWESVDSTGMCAQFGQRGCSHCAPRNHHVGVGGWLHNLCVPVILTGRWGLA